MDEVNILEELSKYANVAAIPVVIAVTNILKRNFDFRHKSNVMALAVSFLICSGWTMYDLDKAQWDLINAGGGFTLYKFFIDLVVSSFATWFAASKAYDIVYGDKKRKREVSDKIEKVHKEQKELSGKEKEGLLKEISSLKEKLGEDNEKDTKSSTVSDQLRNILEKG